jgi:hypothetical protein
VIIDADAHRPSLHKKLKIDNNLGLLNLIVDKSNYEDVIYKHNDYLDVVTCGTNTTKPSEILNSEKFDELLEDISVYITSETYDDYCAEVYIFADGTKYATLTVTVYDKTTWMENSELVNNICEYIKSKYETVDSENKINVSTSDVCYFDDTLSNI